MISHLTSQRLQEDFSHTSGCHHHAVTQKGRPLNVILSFGGGLVIGKCLYNAIKTLST